MLSRVELESLRESEICIRKSKLNLAPVITL